MPDVWRLGSSQEVQVIEDIAGVIASESEELW